MPSRNTGSAMAGDDTRSPRVFYQVASARRCLALAFGLAAFFGVTGCSFLRGVGDFQEGWRTAEVMEVGNASAIQARGYTDCRKTASEGQLASSRFATLSYRLNRRRHVHIVLIRNDLIIAPGDTVYTNVERCGAPIETRSRALTGPPPRVAPESR